MTRLYHRDRRTATRCSCGSATALTLLAVLGLLGSTAATTAQAPAPRPTAQAANPLEITVTANRIPTAIARAGSSVTVIRSDEIERSGASSVLEVLRSVPGVDVSDQGGDGSVSSVRIRGMDARHTLVLVDGVRIGDVASTGGETNFGAIDLSMIDRIEVVRGPQSALYGSDAMGGVVNLITKSGKGPLTFEAMAEGGSYGTRKGGAAATVGVGPVGLAVGGSVMRSDGFSRVKASQDKDATDRTSAHARLSVQAGEMLSFDAGFHHWLTRAEYDNTSGPVWDGPNREQTEVTLGRLTTRTSLWDGRFNSAFTAYAGMTARDTQTNSSFGPYDFGFTGDRVGFDWQSDIQWGALGITLIGASLERTSYDASDSFGGASTASERRAGLFAMHQISLFDRLHLSGAVRIDDFDGFGRFRTWRVTAAYDWSEIGLRLHANAGTGAKAPSLYQRFDPFAGNPALTAETSVGGEVGLSQSLFNSRAQIDVTGFFNTYDDFIDYDFATFNYQQVKKARMHGIEVAARADLIPETLEARLTYTWLDTVDETTKQPLLRRPDHSGRLALIYTGIERLRLEAAVVAVGERRDVGGVTLDPFARVDLKADYRLNANVTLTGRVENLFDTQYEAARGYNTPGLSAYAGVRIKY